MSAENLMMAALTGEDSAPSTPATPSGAPDNFEIPPPPRPGATAPSTPAPASAPTPKPAPSTPAAPQAAPTPALAQALAKSGRTFEGLTDEEKNWFENMSKEAYGGLYPLYKEMKQLLPHKEKLAKLPDLEKERDEALRARWFDHPESYRLNEEYSTTMQKLDRVSQMEEVWREAMVTINDPSAKEVIILARDAEGNIVRQRVPITPEVRHNILFEYEGAKRAVERLTGDLEKVKATHTSAHKNYITGIEKVHEQLFGPYKDILGDAPAKHLASFPATLRARPEGKLLANALALIDMAGDALQKLQAKSAATTAHAGAVGDAPPGRDSIVPTGGKPVAKYSAAEYEEYKRRGWIP